MTNLKKMEWPDVVIDIVNRKIEKPKDLVNYFHFKYITNIGINRWTSPNYITQVPCARKIIDLYGVDFSIVLIDTMFDSYKEIFKKDFASITWSLGILSSEKTGWIMEKIFKIIEKEKSVSANDQIFTLLKKNRNLWTIEENKKFEELINKNRS